MNIVFGRDIESTRDVDFDEYTFLSSVVSKFFKDWVERKTWPASIGSEEYDGT